MIKNRKEAEAIVANFEIVKAFAAGETIQVRPYGDCPWRDADELDLTMIAVDWRVKPASTWRPYTIAELTEKVGSVIRDKSGKLCSIESAGRETRGDFVCVFECRGNGGEKTNPTRLLESYVFEDGSHCGVEVTD